MRQTQVVLILLMLVLILHCLIQVAITVVTVDNISFVVRVTDGKAFIVKEFTLYVYGGFDLKTDSDEIYADKDDGLIPSRYK